jgi:hypothetical protein
LPRDSFAIREYLRTTHPEALDLLQSLVRIFDEALKSKGRPADNFSLVFDTILFQALQSAESVLLLVENGLLDDALTVTRRLMELEIHSRWILADGDATSRDKRIREHLEITMNSFTELTDQQMPAAIEAQWREMGIEPSKRRSPTKWKDKFVAVGAAERYRVDYKLLSLVAHGSPPALILRFTPEQARQQRLGLCSIILRHAAKHSAMVAALWNIEFEVVPDDEVQALLNRAHLLFGTPLAG